MFSRSDARAHEDGGTAIRPGAEHHPTRIDDRPVEEADSRGTRLLEDDVSNLAIRPYREVRQRAADREIGASRTDPGRHRAS